MKKIIITVLAIVAFGLMLSCASELDRKDCARKGRELGAEAKIMGNRCVIKGWGVIR